MAVSPRIMAGPQSLPLWIRIFLSLGTDFSGPDRPWQPESPLYSFWPQLWIQPCPDGDACHPCTPRALGLRKLRVHPELEETDFLAGTPSTQSMSSRPREHACSPGLRSSGVQLRPCILQAETSMQAVEGQLRHCILQAEASMQAAEGPYCWSPIAAPLPEHRGAIASRGQQRPKMPLLLLPGKTKVLDWGPPCEVFENKKKRERRERGKRREREEKEENGREREREPGREWSTCGYGWHIAMAFLPKT